jgi:hypothetical protein
MLEVKNPVGGHHDGNCTHGADSSLDPRAEPHINFELEIEDGDSGNEAHDTDFVAIEGLSLDPPKSEKYWRQVFQWIHECEHHDICSRRSATENGEWYPTRLLDLDAFPSDPSQVKLVISAETKLEGHYMTLSHCWGLDRVFTLTAENQDALMKSIALDQLPKTFVDAIKATRKLGVRYLWIDSLCITQSGKRSKEDWEHESSLMHEVYNRGWCNIAATAASGPTVGLFFDRPKVPAPSRVTVEWNGDHDDLRWKQFHGQYAIIDANILASQVTLSPLMQRAWVFQERILAPRVLHFAADQIFWECGTFQASENYPAGLPELSQTILDRDFRPATRKLLWTLAPRAHPRFIDLERPEPPTLDDRVAHYYAHHGMWNTMVEDYMRCKLTKEEDKLVAIGGVAHFWSHMSIKKDYRAGIWLNELPEALLWYPEPRPDSIYSSFRPKTYRAPSWCWASFEGPILFRQGPFQGQECEVLEVHIENATDNDFGQVKNGFIRLSGCMVEGYSMAADHSDSEHLYIPGKSDSEEWQGFCYPDELVLLDYDRKKGEHKFQCFVIDKALSVRGDHFVTGLMIEETADGKYKRVGLFIIGGDEAVEFLMIRDRAEIVII